MKKLILVFILCFAAFGCGGGGDKPSAGQINNFFDNAPFKTRFEIPSPYLTKTPKGVFIGAQQPIENEAETLQAIDDGISDYLLSTKDNGFTSYRNHSDFNVALLTDFVLDSSGAPALRIKLQDAWKGTEFDRGDGSMLVSGLMYLNVIYIPQSSNHAFTRIITRFESEHFGDPTKTGQHNHPIFPLPASAGFAGRAPFIKVNCGGVVK